MLFKHFLNRDPELITRELNQEAVDKIEKQKHRTQAQKVMMDREMREAEERRERERENEGNEADDHSIASSAGLSNNSKKKKSKKKSKRLELDGGSSKPETKTPADEEREIKELVEEVMTSPVGNDVPDDRQVGTEAWQKKNTQQYDDWKKQTTESEHLAQESMGGSCFGSAFDGVTEMPRTYARLDEVY